VGGLWGSKVFSSCVSPLCFLIISSIGWVEVDVRVELWLISRPHTHTLHVTFLSCNTALSKHTHTRTHSHTQTHTHIRCSNSYL
jgi:hypothetical protein